MLIDALGFDWDIGNRFKNWDKHRVSWLECEELFFNEPLLLSFDEAHSGAEERFYALGQTNAGRGLFISFTVRKKLIRIISARGMSHKERQTYEKS